MSTTSTDASALLRARFRLVPSSRRRPAGMAREGGVSLALHLLAIALAVASVAQQHMHDLPPPSPVQVVFEGGPAAPTPQTQESRKFAPSQAPDLRAREPSPPGAAQPAQPAPAPARPPAQPRTSSPPAAPPEAAEAPPLPAGPTPAPIQQPSRAARPNPVARSRPAPAASSNPFSSLSAPTQISLAGHPPPPASEGHLKRGIELSLAPTEQNRNVMTRYAEARKRLGEDWWAAFSQFVEEHKYYPLSAAERGEDGQSVLKLVIDRDGTVVSAKIELSSGSPRLDMAWLSEFRGAKVPSFPPGTVENTITFSASMTYILEHE